MSKKNIIAFVSSIPKGALKSIRAYEKVSGETYRTMLIENTQRKRGRKLSNYPGLDFLVEADLTKPSEIEKALSPYSDSLCAITSRNESFMSDFIAVIPHVPHLKTPTVASLRIATDKLLMRRAFATYDKKITPKYALFKENTEAERARIIHKIKFPMIVKPSNLAQSLLVSICYHEDELEKVLKHNFASIKKVYAEHGRTESPQIIAEEYMEGLMYSVDAYVNDRGAVVFCPLVRVKTGKEIGHDDFYGYLQMSPTKLKPETIEQAQAVARKGIDAMDLRNTTAHVELLRIDDSWKIIEIGARIGGFRHDLHELSCGIDHSMNDILVRMGKTPIMPKRCTKYAAAMKWYPKQEGTIQKMTGLKKIKELDSFASIVQNSKKGDKVSFAKHGGRAVFHLILAHTDRSQLLADIRRVEQSVQIVV